MLLLVDYCLALLVLFLAVSSHGLQTIGSDIREHRQGPDDTNVPKENRQRHGIRDLERIDQEVDRARQKIRQDKGQQSVAIDCH
jgi:hypothetical protein